MRCHDDCRGRHSQYTGHHGPVLRGADTGLRAVWVAAAGFHLAGGLPRAAARARHRELEEGGFDITVSVVDVDEPARTRGARPDEGRLRRRDRRRPADGPAPAARVRRRLLRAPAGASLACRACARPDSGRTAAGRPAAHPGYRPGQLMGAAGPDAALRHAARDLAAVAPGRAGRSPRSTKRSYEPRHRLLRAAARPGHRPAHGGAPPAIPGRPPAWARLAGALITWLSRGRFGSHRDDLLYVIRKPEDRSARVVVS